MLYEWNVSSLKCYCSYLNEKKSDVGLKFHEIPR